jgi:HlyD family secretion protein
MSRIRRKGIILLAAGIILVILYGLFWNDDPSDRLVASGTVEATEARLGFLAAGRISRIEVWEGDAVVEGQTLASLDRAETMARLNQAIAQVDAARSLLAELEAGARDEELAQARAAGNAAAERLADARRDLERAEKLHEEGAISKEALDKASTAFEVATSQHTQVTEKLREIETGPRREQIDAQRAALAQTEANVAAIEAILSNMVIVAPFDGLVTVRNREPGEVVSPGAPVLAIQNPEDRWVRIFVPEGRIGAVHIGSQADITTDTYPDRSYPGEVIFIASEAEFTPKTVQTTEERVRLVYAVKVRIEGDDARDLKPGMPADVRMELGEK